MDGLSTETIMNMALKLVGWNEIPADSGIHVPGKNIKRLLFTMDANVGLIHMAKQLGFDAVLAHHPCGVLFKQGTVYRRHIELLKQKGIPENLIEQELGTSTDAWIHKKENERFRLLWYECPNQTVLEVDAARLLGMPFLNIHNPLDEVGRRILQSKIDNAQSADPQIKVGSVLELTADLPEALWVKERYGISPKLSIGDPLDEAGKILFLHGALSSPHPDIIEFCWNNGYNTIIILHSEYKNLERLQRSSYGNLILTGHYVGDSIGFTPLIRVLRDKGLEVVCMGGVIDIESNGIPNQ